MAIPVGAIIGFLKSPAGQAILGQAVQSALGSGGLSTGGGGGGGRRSPSPTATLSQLRGVMHSSPMDYAIRGAGAIATGVSDYIGRKAENDANYLAEAILASKRGTQAHDDLFGVSNHDIGLQQAAAEKIRKGQNTKALTDSISNVIDKTLGVYAQREDLARDLAVHNIANPPGNFYNYVNGEGRRNRGGNRR